MNTGEVWESTLDSAVSAMQLSPCLFDKYWPDFTTMARAESNICSSLVNWHIVIDNYWLLDAININKDAVDSRFIGLFGANEIIDLLRKFTHGTHDGEQVTISEVTLFYVVWMNAINNHLRIVNYL